METIIIDQINKLPVPPKYILVNSIEIYKDLTDDLGLFYGHVVFIAPNMKSDFLIMT